MRRKNAKRKCAATAENKFYARQFMPINFHLRYLIKICFTPNILFIFIAPAESVKNCTAAQTNFTCPNFCHSRDKGRKVLSPLPDFFNRHTALINVTNKPIKTESLFENNLSANTNFPCTFLHLTYHRIVCEIHR